MQANKGTTRLTPPQYAALVVRILDNRHGADVISRMRDHLGDTKAARMGPVDLSRNVLRSWCARTCRAYAAPVFASGVTESLATVIGDASASTLVDRFAELGGRPLPTSLKQASARAQRFQECAGYAGVRVGWSPRTGHIVLTVITPDDLELEYHSDDPSEPTVIRHRGTRVLNGKAVEVKEVYDLTDLGNPSYRVLEAGDPAKDITQHVHGRTYTGEGYLREWSDKAGRPYHPIVVRGHPRWMYDRLQQVEASLTVPARWTTWGTGTDFSSHPGRNVRGMRLASLSSDTGEGASGLADGAEVIKQWVDLDDEKPGTHWQDKPAYDPLTNARAIGLYETMSLSMLDLPLQLDATGGEPTAREQEAQEEAIAATLDECRRFDGELLRRCAALANRLEAVQGDNIPEGPFGLLYRGEVAEAFALANPPTRDTEDPDDERAARRGEPGEQDPGGAGEAGAGR